MKAIQYAFLLHPKFYLQIQIGCVAATGLYELRLE